MSKLITVKIDVTKIPKDKIFIGEKGKYINVDLWINDELDQYGNNVSANIRQSKEEREAKDRKTYIGNGKTVFGFDDEPKSEPPVTRYADGTTGPIDDDGGIPF